MAAKHRAPDGPDDFFTSRGDARRGPRPASTRRAPSYKRIPVEVFAAPPSLREATRELPAVRPRPRAAGRAAVAHRPTPRPPTPRRSRTDRVAEAGREYANRAAFTRGQGRPSVTGRATAGAAGGAGLGATLGGPVGAGVGAVAGGVGGAMTGRAEKKAYKIAGHPNAGARRLIVVEFAVCVVIAALSPLTDRKKDEPPKVFMKRLTAIMALFLVLGLISAAGRGAAKFAAGIGGLVTVALALSGRDLFVKLAEIFADPSGEQQDGPGGDDEPGGMKRAEDEIGGRTGGP